MNKVFKIVFGVLVLLILVFLLIWFFPKAEPKFLGQIPKDAETICVVNVPEILPIFLEDKLSENRLAELRNYFEKDSIQNIKGFQESGLDLFNKIAFVELQDSLENYWTVFIEIDDLDDFESFINLNREKLKSYSDYSLAYNLELFPEKNLALAWQKDFIICFKRKMYWDVENIKKRAEKIFSNQNRNNIFKKKFAGEKELYIWKKLSSDIKSAISEIAFVEGKIDIQTNFEIEKDKLDLFQSFQKSEHLNSDNSNNFIVQISDKTLIKNTIENNLKDEELKSLLNKNLNAICLNYQIVGEQDIEKDFITYEYDEDFNKIEIHQKQKSKVPKFVLAIRVNPEFSTKILLEELENKNFIQRKNNFYQTLHFLEYPVYLKKQNQVLFFSNDSNLSIPKIDFIGQNSFVSGSINFEKLSTEMLQNDFLKKIISSDNNLKSLEFQSNSLKGNHLETQAEIKFKSQSNALIDLILLLAQNKENFQTIAE